MSTCPHVHMSRSPHVHLSRSPHVHLSRSPHVQVSRCPDVHYTASARTFAGRFSAGKSAGCYVVRATSSATVGDRAADAAVSQLDDVVLCAASAPQPFSTSPSNPKSPSSSTISAIFHPPAFESRLRIFVVLPAPGKPVVTVAGILFTLNLSSSVAARPRQNTLRRRQLQSADATDRHDPSTCAPSHSPAQCRARLCFDEFKTALRPEKPIHESVDFGLHIPRFHHKVRDPERQAVNQDRAARIIDF